MNSSCCGSRSCMESQQQIMLLFILSALHLSCFASFRNRTYRVHYLNTIILFPFLKFFYPWPLQFFFHQKYEVMKTEDIPNLDNSSFDPNEVLDIAQNIMSFIKRNAAVEGHTYWLYKSKLLQLNLLLELTLE